MVSMEIYRERLLRERDELLAGARRRIQALAATEKVPEDDEAQRLHEDFIRLRLSNMDAERLRMVNEALDRLQTGDYGVCLNCGQPIPDKRLQAVPWARYCVKCQEELASEDNSATEDLFDYLHSPVNW